jgi:hypothetical protein
LVSHGYCPVCYVAALDKIESTLGKSTHSPLLPSRPF